MHNLIEMSILGHKRLVWLPRPGEPTGPIGCKIRHAIEAGDTCGVVPDGPVKVRWSYRGIYDTPVKLTCGVDA